MIAGGACRSRATFTLAKLFDSPLDAQQYYLKDVHDRGVIPPKVKMHTISSSTQTSELNCENIVDMMISLMTALPEEEQYHVVNRVLQVLAARAYPCASVPDDFIKLCLIAMERLKQMGRYNLVHGLVYGLGVMREDGSDSRLPTTKMPIGLLEYIISFYHSESINKVSINCAFKLYTTVTFWLCTYIGHSLPK